VGQTQSENHEMLYIGSTLPFSKAGNLLKLKKNGATLAGTISISAIAVGLRKHYILPSFSLQRKSLAIPC
jgi:hypothetical protein